MSVDQDQDWTQILKMFLDEIDKLDQVDQAMIQAQSEGKQVLMCSELLH
jgi:hypothetical protein